MTTCSRRACAAVLSAIVFACVGAANAQAPAAAPAQSQNMPGPSEVVKEAAEGMLKALDADRAAYKKDPSKVSALVDKYLLPHFDVQTAAIAVLGLNWRKATPDQRKRFVDAFYHSLLSNYGAALVDFTADKLKIYPTNVEPGSDRATVRTEIRRDNGERVPVNYVMRKTPQGWKAIDVQIDGISYVKSYHDDFGAQIDQQGLDAVISRLEKGEKPSEINKTVKKTS